MSVPPMVAASCGIDALIHAWEAYTSLGASPFSDAMAEKAMELIGGNIRRFVANRKDEEAACAMMSGILHLSKVHLLQMQDLSVNTSLPEDRLIRCVR